MEDIGVQQRSISFGFYWLRIEWILVTQIAAERTAD